MRIGPLGALYRGTDAASLDRLSTVSWESSLVTHATFGAASIAHAVTLAVSQFIGGKSVQEICENLPGILASWETLFLLSRKEWLMKNGSNMMNMSENSNENVHVISNNLRELLMRFSNLKNKNENENENHNDEDQKKFQVETKQGRTLLREAISDLARPFLAEGFKNVTQIRVFLHWVEFMACVKIQMKKHSRKFQIFFCCSDGIVA
jgi:hypothetical protein